MKRVVGVSKHLVEDHPASANHPYILLRWRSFIHTKIEVDKATKRVQTSTDSLDNDYLVHHGVEPTLGVPAVHEVAVQ